TGSAGSGQRERDDLRSRRRAQVAAAAGGDDDVLTLVLAEERHGDGVRAGVELRLPELLARLRFERAEPAVDGGADEDQAAGGGDAAADVQGPGVESF